VLDYSLLLLKSSGSITPLPHTPLSLAQDVFSVLSLSFPPRKGYSHFNCIVFLTLQYQPSVYTSVSFVAEIFHVRYF